MALPQTNITTEQVRQTLNARNNDVGALCTNLNINCWSKWKPTKSDVDTLTADELKNKNYSIEILVANTPQALLTMVQNNLNKGYIYNKPNIYRLGDFRNYEHNAVQPINQLFENGETIGLSNISTQELITMQQQQNEYNITVDDIYNCYNVNDERQTLTRGVYFTDGTTEVWSTSTIPWNNNQWQKLATANGNNVIALEFLTNIAPNTINTQYLTQTTDRFYALPQPLHNIILNKDINTSNPQTTDVWVNGSFILSNDGKCVNYNFVFSSIGDEYVGGALRNIAIKLSTDYNDTDVISYANIDDITIGSETTSPRYIGTLSNRYIANENKYYSGLLYIHIYYNNTRQYTKAVLTTGFNSGTLT